jgi:hypothetical protein
MRELDFAGLAIADPAFHQYQSTFVVDLSSVMRRLSGSCPKGLRQWRGMLIET